MSHWSDPAVVVALIGVGTAVFYTLLTGFIWHATWQNTRATRIVLESSQRPYLGITDVHLIFPDTLGGEARIEATVTNVGTVPSRGIEVNLRIIYPGAENSEAAAGTASLAALFQGEKLTATTPLPPECQRFLSGDSLEVFATVRYQGMTEKKYATHGAYKYNGHLDGFNTVSGNFE